MWSLQLQAHPSLTMASLRRTCMPPAWLILSHRSESHKQHQRHEQTDHQAMSSAGFPRIVRCKSAPKLFAPPFLGIQCANATSKTATMPAHSWAQHSVATLQHSHVFSPIVTGSTAASSVWWSSKPGVAHSFLACMYSKYFYDEVLGTQAHDEMSLLHQCIRSRLFRPTTTSWRSVSTQAHEGWIFKSTSRMCQPGKYWVSVLFRGNCKFWGQAHHGYCMHHGGHVQLAQWVPACAATEQSWKCKA